MWPGCRLPSCLCCSCLDFSVLATLPALVLRTSHLCFRAQSHTVPTYTFFFLFSETLVNPRPLLNSLGLLFLLPVHLEPVCLALTVAYPSIVLPVLFSLPHWLMTLAHLSLNRKKKIICDPLFNCQLQTLFFLW